MDNTEQAGDAGEAKDTENEHRRDVGGKVDDQNQVENADAPHDGNGKEKEQSPNDIPKEDFEPKVGMLFDSDEQAYQFYNEYARRIGFSIRKQNMTRSKSGEIKLRRFVCYKEGYYKGSPFDKDAKFLRTDVRTGCNAHIGIKRLKNGKFCVHRFQPEHNHKLASSKKVHLLRSQREWNDSQRSRAHATTAGVNSKSTSDLLFNTSEGHKMLPCTPSGFQNYLHGLRQHEMKLGDAGAITHYLQKKAAEDQQFYSAIQLDMKDQITNVFWTDARSKIDYEHFGDVVCFDTSYKINDYGRPFAQFTGVNNHKQIVIFGAALLYDDTMETFRWLFTAFQEAMNGQAPRVILTDEDAAFIKAIQEVWPNTTYRLCVWLVYQNAVKNLNHIFQSSPSFETDFSRCVYDCEYEDEFISAWQKMLEEYNLTENAWLSKMYEDRKKWAVVYGREIFCADMKSTQRTEHINGVIKTCLNPDKDLLSFFKRYERLVEDRHYNELEADFHAIQSTPEVPLSRLLKQAASIYTPKIYEMFMKEFQLYVDCVIKNCGDEGTASVYEVTNVEKQRTTYVRYDLSNDTVSCSCKKFEFVGILCSHALKVLDHKNIKEIPEKYILKRWRKDVKVGLSINYYDGSSEIDPTVAIASRYTSLGHVYGQIMAKGSKCQEAYAVAIEEAEKLMKKLDLALQNRAHDTLSSESSDDQVENIIVGNKEIRTFVNQKATSFKKDKERRRCRVRSALDRSTEKKARKGLSTDAAVASGTGAPITIDSQLAASSNQYQQWPPARYLSLQFPTMGGQEPLVSSSPQPPFCITNQAYQNESACIMYSQSQVLQSNENSEKYACL
ncbi:protein FAR1-RELATED SEQUENCE 5-like [Phoenix dactylifera]|uniref:Protein FAR1-RELATED SEQUENCE n=1 Tax=Phoenix dactylifera TaxID=42345 RepID=A0A8B7BVP4_PHODC|nr:protein FAR1-RELATED SEQUENCE 5-like [Phoenix dactylifera]XP_008786391.2 protein FAR1-RELATED SEQUENCE 5-like [Phoenix dactylifera]XP_017697702.2 protein FAR1-RELATED SEQUENCE 5-like [Phoenix dactylifera]